MNKSPKRILYPFLGDTFGGSHHSALELLDSLTPDVFEGVVGLHRKGALAHELERRSIAYETLPGAPIEPQRGMLSNLARAPNTLRFSRFLSQQRIELVHAHDGRSCITWSLPAALAGLPFLWHQRTTYQPSTTTALAMRLADHILCNSQFAKSTLPPNAQKKAITIYNPVTTVQADRVKSRHAVVAALRLPDDDDTSIILAAGTLSRQKRPTLFIEAAAQLASAGGQSMHFVWVGADRDGMRDVLESRALELGIADQVHLHGFVTNVGEWIAGSNVLVAPGVDDAFGRTLVEAAQIGTPFVATDSGGHSELKNLGLEGSYVRPDDAVALADAIASTLRSRAPPLSATLRDLFSPQAHAAAVTAIYRQCG